MQTLASTSALNSDSVGPAESHGNLGLKMVKIWPILWPLEVHSAVQILPFPKIQPNIENGQKLALIKAGASR